MNTSPLVSILMNCYNGGKYLQESIDSVVNQTYQNWELIFWDNRSNDNSSEIFLKYKDPRLYYYLSPAFTTLGDARVMASKKIKGKWLGILDTDDIWENDKLTKQITAINNNKLQSNLLGLVYCKTMEIDKNSVIVKKLCPKEYLEAGMPEGRILHDLLLKGNFIPSPSMLINANVFLSIGGFPKGYSHASDYYISCAISSKADVICVDEYLAKYRIHDDNNSHKEKVISLEEQLKIFNIWKKHINASSKEKEGRVKQLNTLAGLMIIKYEKQFIKGLLRILKKGNLFYGIKNILSELKKFFTITN